MSRKQILNRQLTREDFALGSAHSRSALAVICRILVMLVLVAASAGATWLYFQAQQGARLVELQHRTDEMMMQTRALQDSTRQSSLDLALEKATSAELERRIAELNVQLKKANEELAFFKSASGKGGAAAKQK